MSRRPDEGTLAWKALDLARSTNADLKYAIQLADRWRQQLDQVQQVIYRHYPSIAGHATELLQAGDQDAAMEWLAIAQDFALVLGRD